MDIRGMEQYYIATAEGKTEGPYSFENLEVQCNCGMISPETLVCVVGGQEWTEFKTILSQKGKRLPDRHRVEEVRKKLYNPAWASSSKEPQEANFAQKPLTEITVEDMFRGIGIIALIAGVVLALFTFQSSPALAVLELFSGVFSCLGCFWCAKVITLLSRAVNFLSALVRKFDSFSDKQ